MSLAPVLPVPTGISRKRIARIVPKATCVRFRPMIANRGEVYFYVPVASGSDYSGSTVERSNYLWFKETFGDEEWVCDVYGGHSTYAVAVGLTGLLTCADDTFDAVCEALEGLDNYPLFDEEAHSALEMEESDSAWDSWVADDFKRAVEKKFDGCADFDWDAGPDLRTFFEEKREEANEYWFNEGYGHDMYVRIDEVVKGIELADLAAYTPLLRRDLL